MAVTLRYMQEEYFPRQAAALETFQQESGIDVEADFLPVDPFWNDARTAFGDPATWDLLVPDEVVVSEQMARQTLEPLSAHATSHGIDLDDWLPAGIETFTRDGEVFGIPYVAMSNVLIYRHDLLEEFGISVPTTWDDLRLAALDAQRALRMSGRNDVAGFASRGRAGYGHNFWILGSTMFPSWGWEWDRGPGHPPLVNSREAADALTYYAALLREAGPRNVDQLTFTDTHALYRDGKAVFLLDTATKLATMRREGPESAGHASRMTVVPTGPTGRPEPGLYTPAYCIPASSNEKDAAVRLLAHLTSSAEVLADTVGGGYAEPARQSIMDSEEYGISFAADFRETLLETRQNARVNRPMIPNGYQLGQVIGMAAEQVIYGSRTAESALLAAQKDIDLMTWSV